jgi:glutamate dehydrogenase (NAD(P)+)
MKGVMVIDNTARGMGKGGTRMSPTVSVKEIARLARVMTWKWAGVDIFFGGAKCGILADPKAPNKEEILRSWVRALKRHIPDDYVLGLDMGMEERDAAIVQDELGDRGAAVGSPYELGGVPYDELGLTGFGIAEAADTACEVHGFELKGSRVAIQGFGAVGHAAAKRFDELGAAVVSVSTVQGGLHDPDGLDVDKLLKLRRMVGDSLVAEYGAGKRIDLGRELLVEADVVVPAARQDVIDENNVSDIKGRVLIEGANLPTNRRAQEILKERGITVIPDFIANAGAVVGAGVAMDARYSAFRPDADAIYRLISEKMRANARTVAEAARADNVTTHEAATAIAQERVRAAMELKGRLPRR